MTLILLVWDPRDVVKSLTSESVASVLRSRPDFWNGDFAFNSSILLNDVRRARVWRGRVRRTLLCFLNEGRTEL